MRDGLGLPVQNTCDKCSGKRISGTDGILELNLGDTTEGLLAATGYHPATIDIQISDDNEHWTELYHLDYPATVDEPYNFKDFGWWARKGSVRTRYIHYKANCSEIGGFQFTDEIIVR